MAALPTLKIKNAVGDCTIINAADFDPAKHDLFEAPPPPPVAVVVPPPPPSVSVADAALAKLPENWRDKPATELRMLAEVISGRTPENKAQAIQLIEARKAAK